MNKEIRERILPMDLRIKEEIILLSKIKTTSKKKMKSDIRKFVKDAKLKYEEGIINNHSTGETINE